MVVPNVYNVFYLSGNVYFECIHLKMYFNFFLFLFMKKCAYYSIFYFWFEHSEQLWLPVKVTHHRDVVDMFAVCYQLMPLPLTVSCFSKIQIGSGTGSPGVIPDKVQWAVKWMCVYVHWCVYHKRLI